MYTLGWVQLPEPRRGGGVGGRHSDTHTQHILSTVARLPISGPHNSKATGEGTMLLVKICQTYNL